MSVKIIYNPLFMYFFRGKIVPHLYAFDTRSEKNQSVVVHQTKFDVENRVMPHSRYSRARPLLRARG